MLIFYRTISAMIVGLLVAVFLFPVVSSAPDYPRKANYYLKWHLSDTEVRELAKWDLVILDMETQITSRAQLQKLKQLNPEIIILAYITSQEIKNDTQGSVMRTRLASNINDKWYLSRADRSRISFWPGTSMLNISNSTPLVNGIRFNEYLAQFVATQILSSGLWDGVFYDNTWDGIAWFTGDDVDLNKNGRADSDLDRHWRDGMKFLFDQTRLLTSNRYLIVGNATNRAYRTELNGLMVENFPADHLGWENSMEIYKYHENGGATPKLIIVNANTRNTGNKNDYRKVRFGLASALMGDAYYSFDFGDQSHEQLWYYDEYAINLGQATRDPVSTNGNNSFKKDVWRRDFSNGVALVNSTDNSREVRLNGEFEKLQGKQDPAVNDGSIVESVRLAGQDGIVMLKSLAATQKIEDIFYHNGDFLRFFDMNGGKVRNGFFVFDKTLPGGARVYDGDLDGNFNKNEKVVIEDNFRMEILDDRGQRWFYRFPFGGVSDVDIDMAVGYLFGRPEKEIMIAAKNRGHIIMYNYHGVTMQFGFYPFGFRDRSTFALAIGNLDGGRASEAIVGVQRGRVGEVFVYDERLSKLKRRFTVGLGANNLYVASGDVNGDKRDEIIVALNLDNRSVIKTFDFNGKKLSEFTLADGFAGSDVRVAAKDVNFDGKDDIVVMSK